MVKQITNIILASFSPNIYPSPIISQEVASNPTRLLFHLHWTQASLRQAWKDLSHPEKYSLSFSSKLDGNISTLSITAPDVRIKARLEPTDQLISFTLTYPIKKDGCLRWQLLLPISHSVGSELRWLVKYASWSLRLLLPLLRKPFLGPKP